LKKSTLVFVLIVAFVLDGISQNRSCNSIDSSVCFTTNNFNKRDIYINKKLSCISNVYSGINVLLCDFDNDCISELISFSSKESRFNITDSKTGLNKWEFILPYYRDNFNTNIAIGDINNDGIPEIFHKAYRSTLLPSNISGKLLCYNSKGALIWASDQNADFNINNPEDDKIALADFNQDAIPEVYINNKIFNAVTGKKLADGGANGIGREKTQNFSASPINIAAQLDEDSTDLELAAGYSVYKVKISNPNGTAGNSMTAINIKVNGEFRDGWTSVADINNDEQLDVVVTCPGIYPKGLIYSYYIKNNIPILLGSINPNGNEEQIGNAYIGNIDNSNIPMIIVPRTQVLSSYKYDGTINFKKIWDLNTTDSSGYTGLTLFDLNGDGNLEIIYRDETELKIIDGSNNVTKEIARIQCYSPTNLEYPIIGDLDGSGHAKICIPCSDTPEAGFGHLTIFGPPDSLPWAPARSVWNQYAYNPLQINDDLSVPRYQKNQATYMNGKYNNFYQQESLLDSNGMYKVPAASLTGAIQCINYDPLTDEYLVIFDVYNRKDASAIADTNLAISFYDGDPTNGAVLLGIYYSNKKIYRGDSLKNLEFRFPAKNIKDVFMVVNTERNNSGNFNDGDFIQKECDYTDNIFRTIDLPKIDTIHAAICKGNQFVFQDSIYTESGEYIQKLNNSKSCDSIYFRIFITATDSVFVNQKITTCDAYVWNGVNISQSGVYQFDTLNRFGCDSITTLDLTIHKSTQSNSKQTACNRYTWNGTEYTQSGIYQYKTTNAVACDSIAILDLQIHFSDTLVQKVSTCNPFSWNGRTLTQSGIYQFDTINQFTCDSVIILNLQITALIQSRENHSACDQYFWNGKVYTNSGTYDYLTKNALGCDSMITLELKIDRSDSVFTAQTSCAAIDWNGKNYAQSGRYFYETKNIKGCDSVTTLDLAIIPPKENFINKDICDSITILGRKIDRAGRYDFRLTDVNGCDSIIHYDIAIRSNPSNIKLSACDSLLWNVNGKVYTNSTLITEKYNNQYGCDSSITLDLHIAKSKQIFLEASACKEYFWAATQEVLTQSGDYLNLLQTAEQCDSTIHLKLTIHPEYSDTDTIISNQKYTWPVNQITYDSSGNYFIKFISKDQCDSIHYLLLTIIKENNIFYPNVIHPNSQFKQNTAFTIFDNGAIKSIERLRIYDRWGELIWQRENFPSNDVNYGWDGTFRDKAVNPGVFVWVADLLLTDGRKITEKGDVTVVR
jgi:hypothetical protein